MTDVASATSSRRWRPVTRASRQPRQPAREWWERELFGNGFCRQMSSRWPAGPEAGQYV